MAFVLRDCDARMLISEPSLEDVAVGALEEVTDVGLVVLDADESGADYEALLDPDLSPGAFGTTDPHIILYTSGTTGRPKGVMLSHTAVMWFALQQAALYPAMDARHGHVAHGTDLQHGVDQRAEHPDLPRRRHRDDPAQRRLDAPAHGGPHRPVGVTHTVIFPGQMEQFLDADAGAGSGWRPCASP